MSSRTRPAGVLAHAATALRGLPGAVSTLLTPAGAVSALCALGVVGAVAAPASAAAPRPALPQVTIVDVQSGGSGCPQNSATVTYAANRSSFHVGYNRPFAATSATPDDPAEAHCSLVFVLDIPAGWALVGQKLAFYAQYAMGTHSWVRGQISVSYRDANGVPQIMRAGSESTTADTAGQLTAMYELTHRPSICGGRTAVHVEQSLVAMLGRNSDADRAKAWMVTGSHQTDSSPASIQAPLTKC